MDKKTGQALQIELMLIEDYAIRIEKFAEDFGDIEKFIIDRKKVYEISDFMLDKVEKIEESLKNISKLKGLPKEVISNMKSVSVLNSQIKERLGTIYAEENEGNFKEIVEDVASVAYKIIQRVEPYIEK